MVRTTLMGNALDRNTVKLQKIMSGSTGKAVAEHAEISRSTPGLTEAVQIYMYCALVALRGYYPVKGGE